jgi:GntR family transcriptional regulator
VSGCRPSTTFAEQYHTSRPTVRRAIAVLKAEGLVVTEQGRGAYVIRTIYGSDDNPIEVQDAVAAADRHSFRYEVSMR